MYMPVFVPSLDRPLAARAKIDTTFFLKSVLFDRRSLQTPNASSVEEADLRGRRPDALVLPSVQSDSRRSGNYA